MNWNKKSRLTMILVFLLLFGAFATDPAQSTEEEVPDGVMSFTPLVEPMYAAIIFTPPDNMAIDGIIWYNNDEATIFPSVMVAAGYEGIPPNLGDALVIVSNVSGNEDSWSNLSFSQPVMSESGSVYVIFELPAFSSTTDRGVGPGFGYGSSSKESSIFISGDSIEWTQMVTDQRLLVEPRYMNSTAKSSRPVLILGAPTEPTSPEAKAVPLFNRLEQPYPNPFNPATTINFSLASASQKLSCRFTI